MVRDGSSLYGHGFIIKGPAILPHENSDRDRGRHDAGSRRYVPLTAVCGAMKTNLANEYPLGSRVPVFLHPIFLLSISMHYVMCAAVRFSHKFRYELVGNKQGHIYIETMAGMDMMGLGWCSC